MAACRRVLSWLLGRDDPTLVEVALVGYPTEVDEMKMIQESVTEKVKPELGGGIRNKTSIQFMEQGDDGEYYRVPIADVPEHIRCQAAVAIMKAAINQARNVLNGVEQGEINSEH
jgi:hypothetical protein